MRVHVFAVLKDYFDKEFQLEGDIPNATVLRRRLAADKPAAAGILNSCRFAVADEFIDEQYQFKENDTIYIIPPGSGG
jgi:molybdopterin synthase sulfur carrier subunit